jgi:DHA2 family lincomycin resistance protein-like MFS transporter
MTGFAFVGATTPIWMILAAHVLLMVSLAALFTPLFTMGLGVLPPSLYSHGSSLLGTVQQVGGAMGTALAVMIMSSRSESLLARGTTAGAASIGGLQWAFAVSAVLCVVVLGLVLLLPSRIAQTPMGLEPVTDDDAGRQDEAEAAEVVAG